MPPHFPPVISSVDISDDEHFKTCGLHFCVRCRWHYTIAGKGPKRSRSFTPLLGQLLLCLHPFYVVTVDLIVIAAVMIRICAVIYRSSL